MHRRVPRCHRRDDACPPVVPTRKYFSRGAGWASMSGSIIALAHRNASRSPQSIYAAYWASRQGSMSVRTENCIDEAAGTSAPAIAAACLRSCGGCSTWELLARSQLLKPANCGSSAEPDHPLPDSVASRQHAVGPAKQLYRCAVPPPTGLPEMRVAALRKPELICSCGNRLCRPHGQ